MTNATLSRQYQTHQPTHFSGKTLLVILLLVGGVVAGGIYFLRQKAQGVHVAGISGDNGIWPAWMQQPVKYEPTPPEKPAVGPPARDRDAERWQQVMKELTEQRAMLEQLKRQPAKAQPVHSGPKPKPAPMLFLAGTLPKAVEKEAPKSTEPTYLLAPGATKIPCSIETAMNSDVEGYFTAKTRVGVYDTATGQHLLIPQNSTILGHDQSSQLLYGNERMNTLALTLALPDGTSVDLGQAPVTDLRGVAGLTGKVNNHWWRLVGAVLVKGALQGGAQVAPMLAGGGGIAAPVGTSIAQQGNQAGQMTVGRSMDTRPTIDVAAGQLCTVILIKPLMLKAFHS